MIQATSLGVRLRMVRRARNLSVRACAADLGVSPSSVVRWEQHHNEPTGCARRILLAWLLPRADETDEGGESDA